MMRQPKNFARGTYRIFLACLSFLAVSAGAEVVTVVSAKSAVSALSRNQVADIFLGRTSRFPDGNHAIPIDQAENSLQRDRFYAAYVGKSPAQLKAHWSKIIFTGRGTPPQEIGSDGDVKKFLATHPGAIGYIDSSALDDSVRAIKIAP